MFRIVILDGDERVSRSVLDATTEADFVVGADGEVILCRDQHLTRINITELRRVITTQARQKRIEKEPANA